MLCDFVKMVLVFSSYRQGGWARESALESVEKLVKSRRSRKLCSDYMGWGSKYVSFKNIPGAFQPHLNLVTFGLCDLYDVYLSLNFYKCLIKW